MMTISLEKRNKYGARRTTLDGYTFDSQAEARRYQELRLLERGGYLSELKVHHRFPLEHRGVHVCDYVADFLYRQPDGRLVVEDVKSPPTRTALYKLKRKLFELEYELPILEVDSRAIR